MAKKIVCICDYDTEYPKRFSRFIWKRESSRIDVYTFSQLTALRDFLREKRADIIIVSEEFYEDSQSCSKKIKLPEERTFLLSSGTSDYSGRLRSFDRYSSALDKLNIILTELKLKDEKLQEKTDADARIIGVYSPCKRCGKTTLSIALGRAAAESGKTTLLVSLEDMCGTQLLKSDSCHLGISDMLYSHCAGMEGKDIDYPEIKTEGNLSLVLAAACPEDIRETDRQGLTEIIKRFADMQGFERVVIDVGDALAGPWEILSLCDIIVMPQLSDDVSASRGEQFVKMAEAYLPNAREKLRRVHATNDREETARMAAYLLGSINDGNSKND